MKIKYKLTSIIFFVIVLVSAANYQLFTKTFEALQTKRLQTAEAILGTSLAARLVRPLIEKRQSQVTATLIQEKLLRDKKISYFVVFDDNNRLFSHTYLTEIPETIYNLKNTFTKDQEYRIDFMEESELEVFNIAVPIHEGIQQMGTLHVGISTTFIHETASPLKKATTSLVLFAIIISLFGGLLAILASYALTKSITQLQDWALRLSEGDYTADITIQTRDEIALLADSFRKMRDKIQIAHRKLADQNETLETKVALRTAELEKSHEELLHNNDQLKKLAEDLEQERKNLKIVFSAMDYPLFVVNRDFSIAMMNDRAAALAEENHKDAITCYKATYNTASPCSNDSKPCPMDELLKTRQPVTLEHHYTKDDGQNVIMEIRAFPIFDDQGEIVQIVESFIDITEKRLKEDENIHLERELNRAAKMESVGTLAAGVAHEINTPIQFIGDNTNFASESVADLFEIISKYKTLVTEMAENKTDITERIKEIDDDGDLEYILDELPKALEQTGNGIQHVAEIVKAMKDFSHLGGGEENMLPANLNEAIETTLTISKNEWKYEADIIRNLADDLPTAHCQIGEIKQVLLNLIVNAAHAIADRRKQDESITKGTIEITTSHANSVITVAIADSGTGIADEHKNRIFDHFFTTKEVGRGTGQGLSMAYQIIVDIHGGELWFDSEVGRGTTFYFTLKAS